MLKKKKRRDTPIPKIQLYIFRTDWTTQQQSSPKWQIQQCSEPDYSFWDHKTPHSWRRCQKSRDTEDSVLQWAVTQKSTVTTCQVLTRIEGRGNVRYFHGTLWLYNTALSRPGLVSSHIVVSPYELWDLCTSLHCVLLLCLRALLLNASCLLKAMGKKRKMPLLLANCNAVQCRADSRLFHKPTQNWTLPPKSELKTLSVCPQEEVKKKSIWEIQARKDLPGAWCTTNSLAALKETYHC